MPKTPCVFKNVYRGLKCMAARPKTKNMLQKYVCMQTHTVYTE